MKSRKKVITGMFTAAMLLGSTCFVSAADNAWVKDATGWRYQNADFTYANSSWKQDKSGQWYHFNAAGYMQTGWILDNGKWYYMNHVPGSLEGAMKTGWIWVNGKWYYMNPVSDGTKGAMQTGWVKVENKWYYFDKTDGDMAANTWVTDGSVRYYVGTDGAWTGATNDVPVSSSRKSGSSHNNNNHTNQDSDKVLDNVGLDKDSFGEGVETKKPVVDEDKGTTTVVATNKTGDTITIITETGNSSATPTVVVEIDSSKPMQAETVQQVKQAESAVSEKLEESVSTTVAKSKSDAKKAVQENSEVKVAVVLSEASSSASTGSVSKAQTVSVVAQKDTDTAEVKDTAETVAESIIDQADDSSASVVYNGKAYSQKEAKAVVGESMPGTVKDGERVVYVLINGEYVEYTINVDTVDASGV